MIFIEKVLCLLLSWYFLIHKCNTETITYISTERPKVDWFDKKFFKNFTLLSKRLYREDPRHYVDLHMHPLFAIGNNVKLEFWFYQFFTNRYRPSFVEMYFRFCNMLNSDTVFGPPMKKALGSIGCPIPPGEYHLHNMTIPYVPKGFPFTKGRIYCNVSNVEGASSKYILRGSIDMEIKVAKIKKKIT